MWKIEATLHGRKGLPRKINAVGFDSYEETLQYAKAYLEAIHKVSVRNVRDQRRVSELSLRNYIK